MFKKLAAFFSFPTPAERLAKLAEQVSFAIQGNFPDGYSKGNMLVEVSLEKIIAANHGQPRLRDALDLSNLRNEAPGRMARLFKVVARNEGAIHVPVLEENGGINDGFHRIALLHNMGVKTIPVLLRQPRDLEKFKETFGVAKTHYRMAGSGTYYEFQDGYPHDFPATLVAPIERAAIMQPPKDYVPPIPDEPPGTQHGDRLKTDGTGRADGPRRNALPPKDGQFLG